MGQKLFEQNSRSVADSLGKALILTVLVQLLATSTALVLPPIAPRVAADFGVDAYVVGYQVSLLFTAGAFGSVLSGALIRSWGALRTEQFGLCMFALGLLGLATANISVGVIASLLIGFAYGVQNPASSQILSVVTPPDRRNVVFSIKQAAAPLGVVLVSISLPLLDAVMGWRTAFLLLALLPSALLVILAGHKMPHTPPQNAVPLLRGLLKEQRLIWRRGDLRVLTIIGFLYSSVQLTLSTFAVLMLTADCGWKLIPAASAAAGVQAFGVLGRVCWGVVADRLGSGFGVLAIVGLGSGAALLAMPWMSEFPAYVQVGVLSFLGFCLNGWNGVAMAEVLRHAAPADVGSVMGSSLVYVFAGVMVGPASFALLYEIVGSYGGTFAFASVVLLIGGSVALLVRPKLKGGG